MGVTQMDLGYVAWLVCISIYVRAEGFGPFDMKFYNYQRCTNFAEDPKITIDIKQKRYNRNTIKYDLILTNKIPFDDNLSTIVNIAERSSRGGFNENSIVKEFPKTCTVLKTFMPGIFNIITRELKKATGENLATCHLPPGTRSLSNLTFNEKSKKIVMLAPAFWYKQYIMRQYLKKQGDLVSCGQFNVDIVPKKN